MMLGGMGITEWLTVWLVVAIEVIVPFALAMVVLYFVIRKAIVDAHRKIQAESRPSVPPAASAASATPQDGLRKG